ncbi:MAG: hypothetical protein E6K04_05570 [Methanobacteriota archaeon]|nr:MAG: hypothetical protein E6K04_05570 [Euryarchaeota archaeon]
MKTTTLRNLSFVVMVLGLLLVLGGVSLFVAANGPRDRAYTFSLPNQANRYQRIQVSILTAGSIDVVYQSDYAIMIWVMTEAQHADFLQTGQAQGLGQDTGISGGFTTALPSGGLDPTLFSGGLGCVVGGMILAVVGLLYRGVAKKREATMSPFYGPGGVGAAGYPGTQYPWPGAAVAPPPGIGVPSTGTILLTLENSTSAEETVRILIDGSEVATLTIPAGATQRASLPMEISAGPATSTSLEAVTAGGKRLQQSVTLVPGGAVPVSLRLEPEKGA